MWWDYRRGGKIFTRPLPGDKLYLFRGNSLISCLWFGGKTPGEVSSNKDGKHTAC